jgi:hypothetical protein
MNNCPPSPESAHSLVKSGRHLDALRQYALLLQEQPDHAETYRGACGALLAAVNENVRFEPWPKIERDLFLSTLVLQERCDESPPIFHNLLTGQYTSGGREFLVRITRILDPIVQELHSRAVSKNLVLMMLLLRDSLGGWIDQDKISNLHITWFDKFTFGDLAIPYNCMFDQNIFRKNCDDLSRSFSIRHSKSFDSLSLYHIVFLEWLSQRDAPAIVKDGGLPYWLKAKVDGLSKSAIDVAAAKSLIVRHWPVDQPLGLLNPGGSQFGVEFVEFASNVISAREKLRSASSTKRHSRLGVRLFDNRNWQALQAAQSIARSRFPSNRNSKRKKKVAICVSGQLRGYSRAFRSWKGSLLREVDYDLFVHSWMAVGRSGAEPYRYVLPFEGKRFVERYREVCQQIGFDEFKARYPILFQTLAETGRITEQQLSEFYGTPFVRLDDDTVAPYTNLSNQEKMHSKIESCFDMAMASGKEYDLVIRLRPDKSIKYLGFRWGDVCDICHSAPTVFTDLKAGIHYTNLMMGDQFAIGARQPMEIYSSTFSRFPRLYKHGLLNCSESFVGHASLAQVCWSHGIEMKKIPIRFGLLENPDSLSPAVIARCLNHDAEGRNDRIDSMLLGAVASDLKM